MKKRLPCLLLALVILFALLPCKTYAFDPSWYSTWPSFTAFVSGKYETIPLSFTDQSGSEINIISVAGNWGGLIDADAAGTSVFTPVEFYTSNRIISMRFLGHPVLKRCSRRQIIPLCSSGISTIKTTLPDTIITQFGLFPAAQIVRCSWIERLNCGSLPQKFTRSCISLMICLHITARSRTRTAFILGNGILQI